MKSQGCNPPALHSLFFYLDSAYCVPKTLARLKRGNVVGWNSHRLTRLKVPALPLLTVCDRKGAKAREGYSLSALESNYN